MIQDEILERVKKIVAPYCEDPAQAETAGMETSLLDDLHVNSARLVDIVLAFEDEFDLEIGDDQIDGVRTLGDAVGMIQAAIAPEA